MTHRLPLLAGAILACLPVLAVPAEAQSVPSPYDFIDERREYGIFVGSVPGNRGELDLGPGGGTIFGIRFGQEISGPFAIEGNAYLLPSDRRIRAPGQESGIDDLGLDDALIGGFDGRLRFSLTGPRTWYRLAPFLSAGGGVAMDLKGRSALEEAEGFPEAVRFSFGPSFVGIMGAGVRWLPLERITIRAEATVHYWKLGTPEAYLQRGDQAIGQPVPEQEWSPVSAITVGLSYRR